MGKCYSRLSFQERLVIQKLYKKGMTMAETEKIARIIGRNRTTIYREVLHNTSDGQPYNAKEAQKRAKANLKQKNIAKQLARGETTRKKVYVLFRENPDMTVKDMAGKIGCSRATVSKYLSEIKSGSYISKKIHN